MQRKEWLWLILPSLFLLGFGFYLQWSKEQPFEFVAEKMTVAPSDATMSGNGYDTEVTLVMIPKGTRPNLLSLLPNNKIPLFSWAPQTSVFYNRDNKKRKFIWPTKVKDYTPGAAIYDKETNRFIAHTWINMAAVPKSLGKLTCEMKMTLLRLGAQDNLGRYKTTIITSTKSELVVRP